MRKKIAVMTAAVLLMASSSAAFAAAPKDVEGTSYESAVVNLIDKGVISGYTDGSFKPENTLNRAEACVIVVKAMSPTDAELKAAKSSGFTDLQDFSWAESAINYAAENGIVSGVGNGLFKPDDSVTYNEFAAMLINALQLKGELTGSWPANYYNKASELGIFKGTDPAVTTVTAAEAAAVRGNVAIMADVVVDDIAKANTVQEPEEEEKPEPKEEEDEKKEEESDNASGSTSDQFADTNGRVFGMILNVSQVVDSKGNQVEEIEMLIGNKTYNFITNGSVSIPDRDTYMKELYALRLFNGTVRDINPDGAKLGSSNFKEFTKGTKANAYMVEVADNSSNLLTLVDGTTVSCMANDTQVYEAKMTSSDVDEYTSTRPGRIAKGDYIRAYDIVGDGMADVVVVVKEKDIDTYLSIYAE